MSDAVIDTPRVRTHTRRRRLKASFNPASLVGLLVLLVFVAITLYPLVLVVSTALKDPLDVTLNPFSLFSSFHPQNFRDAWREGGFRHYFVNTVVITVPSVLGIVALSTLAGYALARLPFPGRDVVFFTLVLGLMIP